MSKARLRRASKAQPETRSSRNSLWLIGSGILLIGAIIFAAIVSSDTTPTITSPTTSSTVSTLPVAGQRTTLGNPEATIDTAGTVKLEFHHFPLVNVHGQNAARAAEASECAADQDAFWPYHDRLFEENRTRGQQNRLQGFVYDTFIDYAEELGLDVAEFTQCIGENRYEKAVNDSMQAAFDKPLSSTPSIIINGQVMPNPFSYPELKQEIDRLLAGEATES